MYEVLSLIAINEANLRRLIEDFAKESGHRFIMEVKQGPAKNCLDTAMNFTIAIPDEDGYVVFYEQACYAGSGCDTMFDVHALTQVDGRMMVESRHAIKGSGWEVNRIIGQEFIPWLMRRWLHALVNN